MDALILELKNKIIEVLNLEEVTPEDIDENLDDPKKGKEIFQSVKTMADYITAHRTK